MKRKDSDPRRKITMRLYPNATQEQSLLEMLELHREIYNAALAERIDAWKKHKISVNYYDQQNSLPALKKELPELKKLGSQALQETLRRLDRAFSAFFSRVAKGETPGFPRFKGKKAFASFTYPAQSGWELSDVKLTPTGKKSRKLELTVGSMKIKARGRFRFDNFNPKELTIKRIAPGIWEAIVTVQVTEEQCARGRTGNAVRGSDQGITDRIVYDDGQSVPNSRLLRNKLDKLADLQKQKARCKKGSRNAAKLKRNLAILHRHIASQRKDENHKQSAQMVKECALLATEELAISNMVRRPKAKPELDANGKETGRFLPNGAAAKAGLNRELNSAAFGSLLAMLKYKAAEAGTKLHMSNTRKLKPTQRCACCGTLVAKGLEDRTHICTSCGFIASRDRNAALVCLIDALWPDYYEKSSKENNPFTAEVFSSLVQTGIEPLRKNISLCTRPASGTDVDIATGALQAASKQDTAIVISATAEVQ